MRSLSYFKHKLILTLALLTPCLLLTGCGVATKLGIMSFGGTFGIGMLILTSTVCIVQFAKLMISTTSQERGTNSASRFVRHTYNYKVQKNAIKWSAVILAPDLVGLIIGFTIPKLLITLMPIGVMIYALILMNKGTKDKQRVQATRDVTKAGLTAGKYAAVAGAAVGAPVVAGGVALAGGGALAAAAAAGTTMITGTAIAEGAERVHGVMEDVDHNRPVREFPELSDGYVISADEFRKKAIRLGCDASMDPAQMADVVIKYAPEASLNELPPDMDKVEKAARLLGTVHKAEEVYSTEPLALPDNN